MKIIYSLCNVFSLIFLFYFWILRLNIYNIVKKKLNYIFLFLWKAWNLIAIILLHSLLNITIIFKYWIHIVLIYSWNIFGEPILEIKSNTKVDIWKMSVFIHLFKKWDGNRIRYYLIHSILFLIF